MMRISSRRLLMAGCRQKCNRTVLVGNKTCYLATSPYLHFGRIKSLCHSLKIKQLTVFLYVICRQGGVVMVFMDLTVIRVQEDFRILAMVEEMWVYYNDDKGTLVYRPIQTSILSDSGGVLPFFLASTVNWDQAAYMGGVVLNNWTTLSPLGCLQ